MMWQPPYHYLAMPVDKAGNGPAEEEDTARVIHEVWDAGCMTVCQCDSEAGARWVAEQLNKASTT